MSYILEALEKSEQQRKQRQVPTLQSQPAPYPGISQRRQHSAFPSGYLLPVSVGVVLLILIAWLFSGRLPLTLEITITSGTSQSERTAQDGTDRHLPPTTQNSPDLQDLSSDVDQAGSRIAAGRVDRPDRPASLSATRVSSGPTVSQDAPRGATSRPGTSNPGVRLQPAPLILTEDNSIEAAPAMSQLPFPDELPPSIRQQLPTLRFAGHTYADRPADRLIIINGSIRREGERAERGLTLEEITWEGVILDFQGTRFQVVTTGPDL
ncbi:MAG: general secretion pathway protein GspB [Desulfopila sp.]